MVNITIDGIKLEVEDNITILEAARQADIEIPTLCDHEALTPYGGCRLCVVEVDGLRTLQPSCTLPVVKDMVVHTDSEKVREARKFVLTMIFSERNHFCPYCNVTGGDCELQNSAYAEGMTHWPIQPNWQPYPVDASHPFIVLEHNRCILCRRCVRACNELVGNFTLEFSDRGENSMLIADLDVPLGESSCISCGTCIQVCPTGTLIDRWSAYQGIETELDTTNTICQGCSVGCNINVLTRDNRLVRIEGDWDGEINGGVICDVGRFYPMVDQRERISNPLIKKNGSLVSADWKEALTFIKSKLNSTHGKKVGVASTRLSLEALDIFNQLCETLEFSTIGSTEGGAFTDSAFEFLKKSNAPFEEKLNQIHNSDCYLLLGEDITKDHQVVSFFIKRNLPKGAKLIQISEVETGLNRFAYVSLNIPSSKISDFLVDLSILINSESLDGIPSIAKKYNLKNPLLKETAELLKSSSSPAVIFGSRTELQDYSAIFESAVDFTSTVKGIFLSTKGNINSLGAAQLGINNSIETINAGSAIVAVGDEELDEQLVSKLQEIPFLVILGSFTSDLTKSADVVLPVGNWLEQDGHFLTADGHLLESHAALSLSEKVLTNYDALFKLAEEMEVSFSSTWKNSLVRPSVVEIK